MGKTIKYIKRMFARQALKRTFVQHFVAPRSQWKEPVRVAVTGAAGNIGYSVVYRIANGEMLGPDQPVILHLIDLPFAMNALKGVAMELDDCAFPLLAGIVSTDNASVGFKDVDCNLLIGSKPRGPGMERGDLLKDNGKIFIATGKAINDNAKRTCKTLVVGNPANTNCLILANHCPDMAPENFMAMTRLDHDRAVGQLGNKLGQHVDDIHNFCIWGNHSPTMYPDVSHATLSDGRKVTDLIDQDWLTSSFYPTVQQRGKAIIDARGASSAASAGNAAIAHMRDWVNGTQGHWQSMGTVSDGSYGITKGLVYSFPTVIDAHGKASMVRDLPVSDHSRVMMDKTMAELQSERDAVAHMLN